MHMGIFAGKRGKLMLKKMILLAMAMMLCAGVAIAEEPVACWSADFDGDGAEEQYVIEGEAKALYTAGDLVYIDGEARTTVMKDAGFLPDECAVWPMEDCVLFKAEESYGIGGTVSHVYVVREGIVSQTNGLFSGLTHIEGREFYYMFQDNDLKTDRSGKTLKPYYAYWQDGFFYEHGGLYISEEQLAAWPEGYRALEWIYENGNRVTTIFYRENGIVNISYSDNVVNGNISLLLQDGELMILNTRMKPTDMPEDANYGGEYLIISGASRYATFPQEGFPQPVE